MLEEGEEEATPGLDPAVLVGAGEAAALVQVLAGAEGAVAGGRQDHGSHRRVGGGVLQPPDQRAAQLAVERVQAGRAVQRQRPDRTLGRHEQRWTDWNARSARLPRIALTAWLSHSDTAYRDARRLNHRPPGLSTAAPGRAEDGGSGAAATSERRHGAETPLAGAVVDQGRHGEVGGGEPLADEHGALSRVPAPRLQPGRQLGQVGVERAVIRELATRLRGLLVVVDGAQVQPAQGLRAAPRAPEIDEARDDPGASQSGSSTGSVRAQRARS